MWLFFIRLIFIISLHKLGLQLCELFICTFDLFLQLIYFPRLTLDWQIVAVVGLLSTETLSFSMALLVADEVLLVFIEVLLFQFTLVWLVFLLFLLLILVLPFFANAVPLLVAIGSGFLSLYLLSKAMASLQDSVYSVAAHRPTTITHGHWSAFANVSSHVHAVAIS